MNAPAYQGFPYWERSAQEVFDFVVTRTNQMGFYIERSDGSPINKAKWLIETHGAEEIHLEEWMRLNSQEVGLVVVWDNGFFEAALFCYNKGEQDYVIRNYAVDSRPTRLFKMDLATAKKLAGYNK